MDLVLIGRNNATIGLHFGTFCESINNENATKAGVVFPAFIVPGVFEGSRKKQDVRIDGIDKLEKPKRLHIFLGP